MRCRCAGVAATFPACAIVQFVQSVAIQPARTANRKLVFVRKLHTKPACLPACLPACRACLPACQVSCCNAASPVAGGWWAGGLVGLRACVLVAQIEGGGRALTWTCRSRHPPRTIFYFLANTHVKFLQTKNRSNCPIGKQKTVVL